MFKRRKLLKEPENFEKAYEYAVFLLSLRLRTTGEIEHKMKERGFAQPVIQKITRELTDRHYLDDEKYAQVFLENLKKYKTFGFYGVKKKFMEKRLPLPIISSVLEEGLPVEEEMKIAKKYCLSLSRTNLASRPGSKAKFADNHQNGEYREKQKLAQKLRARGFRSDVIAKLLF
ncbi:MAG: hypothetical protein COT92_00765 [Candidatus Doudnabacteria bacterium CG10_big_fil_rev_8_21_14_0_10_42_18]|uniref:Regulatory protein RecX n=1 Tax=Candidatus Doudnabacteria bacterium CG10_big_fil_rev_8_21_14_0_10_42_18 TaxID=1974552 RepID=A0A2H0VBN6_9BACT|nr:MAG: hypothetical protein COT92_00765 [Candidatus Doudnabacteria bacterium CG10_big_fil_rev_8_21_14_0_10_42_18]